MRLAALLLAAVPVLVDRPGDWTLSRLHARGAARVVRADSGYSFRWRAPNGGGQGAHNRWYLVRFHARLLLDVRRTTFEAAGDVASSTGPGGEYTCASDVVNEQLVGDTIVYSWYSAGQLEATGVAAQPVLEIDDTTQCIHLAIRPGTLTTRLRATGFGEHAGLAVLPDSGIVLRRGLAAPPVARPAPITLGVRPPPAVHIGGVSTLRVRVTGAGSRFPGGRVTLSTPGGPVGVVGRSFIVLPAAPAGRALFHTFRIRGARAGTSWLLVRIAGHRTLVVVKVQ